MTEVYVKIRRGLKTQNIEIEDLTDTELNSFFSTQTATETKDIARHLVRIIRVTLRQYRKIIKEAQMSPL